MNKAQKENVQSDNSDDYLFMTCKSNKKERPMSKIKIYDITIDMLVDTGATVNVIDLNVKLINNIRILHIHVHASVILIGQYSRFGIIFLESAHHCGSLMGGP